MLFSIVCQINTSNLFEADIADLDGDGKSELIIITEIPGGKPEYGYDSDISIEIYKLINCNVVLLDSISSDTARWDDFANIKKGTYVEIPAIEMVPDEQVYAEMTPVPEGALTPAIPVIPVSGVEGIR